jgi:hypothetical protein
LTVEVSGSAFTGAGAGVDISSKELTPMGLGEGAGTCHVIESWSDLVKEIYVRTRVKRTAMAAIFRRRCCRRPILMVHGSRHNGKVVFGGMSGKGESRETVMVDPIPAAWRYVPSREQKSILLARQIPARFRLKR